MSDRSEFLEQLPAAIPTDVADIIREYDGGRPAEVRIKAVKHEGNVYVILENVRVQNARGSGFHGELMIDEDIDGIRSYESLVSICRGMEKLSLCRFDDKNPTKPRSFTVKWWSGNSTLCDASYISGTDRYHAVASFSRRREGYTRYTVRGLETMSCVRSKNAANIPRRMREIMDLPVYTEAARDNGSRGCIIL
jgi:hypothetical protein